MLTNQSKFPPLYLACTDPHNLLKFGKLDPLICGTVPFKKKAQTQAKGAGILYHSWLISYWASARLSSFCFIKMTDTQQVCIKDLVVLASLVLVSSWFPPPPLLGYICVRCTWQYGSLRQGPLLLAVAQPGQFPTGTSSEELRISVNSGLGW